MPSSLSLALHRIRSRPDLTPSEKDALCIERRAAHTAYNTAWRKAKCERDPEYRERMREQQRRSKAKRLEDPEQRALVTERERERQRIAAQEKRAAMSEQARLRAEKYARRNAAARARHAEEKARLASETEARRAAGVAAAEESERTIAERLSALRALHRERARILEELSELALRAGVGLASTGETRAARARLEKAAARLAEPIRAARAALDLPEVLDGDGAAERSEGQEALRGPKVHTTGGRRMGARHGTHGVTRGIQKKATATAKEAIK